MFLPWGGDLNEPEALRNAHSEVAGLVRGVAPLGVNSKHKEGCPAQLDTPLTPSYSGKKKKVTSAFLTIRFSYKMK